MTPVQRRVALCACLGALIAAAVLRIAVHDPGDRPLRGDQASFVYNAISLAQGDLAYDEQDHERWVEIGWTPYPHGLFAQLRDDGWAAAKPIGYSVLLAPAVALGGLRGVAVLGALMVLAYAGLWYAIARHRWDRPAAAAVAAAATLASHAWFYGFVAHADLFVAALVGVAAVGCLRARQGEAWALVVAAASVGLLTTEKVPAVGALLPLLVVAAARVSIAARAVAAGALVAVAALSMAPYLYYSDGASWSAYGGDRYYLPGATPWTGAPMGAARPIETDEVITVSFLVDRLADPSDDLPSAAVTYVVGRHTGVMTFLPIVPLLTASSLAVVLLRRRRGAHAPPQAPRSSDLALAGAAGLGLVLYVAFYLLLFTDNYYGGGQSIGNRYFLQISPLAAVIPVAVALSARAALRCAAGAAVWAVAVIGPDLVRADRAFSELHHTSALQRLLPFEHAQDPSGAFLPPGAPRPEDARDADDPVATDTG